jgi:hypothetical protein
MESVMSRTITYVAIILAVAVAIWYFTRPAVVPVQVAQRGIGKPAPEITGEDIDGKPLKLSDYRGKVVVLDFWGNW